MKKMNFTKVPILVFKISGLTAAGFVLLTFFASITQSVMIVVLAEFLDGVLNLFNDSKGMGIQHVLILICCYTVLQLFTWLQPNIFEWLNAKCRIKIKKHCSDMLLDKYARIQYRFTENAETLDLINRIMLRPEEKILDCFHCYLQIAGFIVKVTGILVILASVTVWTTLFIVICAIPLFFLAVRSGRAEYEAAKEVTRFQREAEYFSEIALGKEYVYERKLFQYGGYINRLWKEKAEFARRTRLKTSVRWYIKNKTASVFTAMIGIVTTLVLIDPVLNGQMTIGLYISLAGAVYEFVKVMAWDFMENIDSLAGAKEYLKDFNEFFSLEEDAEDENKEESSCISFEKLEFQNISFRYPNAENYTIKDLSLIIEAGKKYCIVGVNGSGKTTMVKLILGLYDNYEGKILLNGKDIKMYSKTQIGRIFSAVFQDFSKYGISVKENILLGGLKDDDVIGEDQLSDIVKEVGLEGEFEKMEQGMDTVLGNRFKEGQDFSGGQWQRLAIARNLAGGSHVVFFDEPTAALDPIAERNFYHSLENLIFRKTIVVISHRLAVARHSDMIYVIDDGKVSERGSFKQLMERQGAFFRMYKSQRRWYDEAHK